jgi:Uma2 family endonuclease
MSTLPKPYITPEQYLEIEAQAERKSEYYNGQMFLMAGANSDHNLITSNLNRVFGNEFLRRPCYVYTSEMRVQIPATGLYTYPDAILVCGERQWADPSETTLLNPAVIIEVLSDSTEIYDRVGKFLHYKQVPSFREYILIPQNSFRIDQHTLQSDGNWTIRPYASIDDTLEVTAVGCSIPLRDIYFKTRLMS